MAKLKWEKADQYEPDPARFLKKHDFEEYDRPVEYSGEVPLEFDDTQHAEDIAYLEFSLRLAVSRGGLTHREARLKLKRARKRRTPAQSWNATMKKELTDLGFDAPPEECVAAAGTARENLDLPKAERLRECGDLLSKALRKKDY